LATDRAHGAPHISRACLNDAMIFIVKHFPFITRWIDTATAANPRLMRGNPLAIIAVLQHFVIAIIYYISGICCGIYARRMSSAPH
jgi:uncharacterized membrane protein (DUF485 family)